MKRINRTYIIINIYFFKIVLTASEFTDIGSLKFNSVFDAVCMLRFI